tara:strand:+ start:882 stop:1418 length:537 start_codon:yes stop_codon:yes gene_type:complete
MKNIYKKETINQKQKRLLSVVESVYTLNLNSKSRKKDYVSARVSYIHILRGLGLTYSYIGRLLNKNHATIIHGSKLFSKYYEFDSKFCKSHNKIVNKYEKGGVEYFDIEYLKLESQVKVLKSRIKELDSQNTYLISKLKDMEEYNKKNESMHKLINHKVTPKTEKEIQLKLNRFLNGI